MSSLSLSICVVNSQERAYLEDMNVYCMNLVSLLLAWGMSAQWLWYLTYNVALVVCCTGCMLHEHFTSSHHTHLPIWLTMRVLFLILLSSASALAWYLPGMAPINFKTGQPVELKVNSLDSVKTQMPFEYYHIPFCKPEGEPVQSPEVIPSIQHFIILTCT
jgi:hypothetical protein